MDATKSNLGTIDVDSDRGIQILNILLDCIQDGAPHSDKLPTLDDETINLDRITIHKESSISISFHNRKGWSRRERFFVTPQLVEAVFGKLMAPDWSVVDRGISNAVTTLRTNIYKEFSRLIAMMSCKAEYRQLYISNIEAIIKFSANPNSHVCSYGCALWAIRYEEKITAEHKIRLLECITHECNKLIQTHKNYPECRTNLDDKLSEMYGCFLYFSKPEDRKILWTAGQRLRAYLYQNRIIGRIEREETSDNAFTYNIHDPSQMRGLILGADESSCVFEYDSRGDGILDPKCPEFKEGYIICGALGIEGNIFYITVNDTKFPDNFLGVGGLEKLITDGIDCWKKLLLRDYREFPCSFVKTSFLRAVIACLTLLRTGAKEELKQFILSCSLEEIHGIYKAIFEIGMSSEQNVQQDWENNRDFLIQLFNLNLRQRFIEAAGTVGTSGQYDAQATIKIVDETSSVKDNSNATLPQIATSVVNEDSKSHNEDGEKSKSNLRKIFIEAAETVDLSGQYDAQARIGGVDRASSVKDNSHTELPQIPKSQNITDDKKTTPHKRDEQKSPKLIWKALAFTIVVALTFLWIYSKRNPFKILGRSKSATLPFLTHR